jgi:hypothetical protein
MIQTYKSLILLKILIKDSSFFNFIKTKIRQNLLNLNKLILIKKMK